MILLCDDKGNDCGGKDERGDDDDDDDIVR